MRSFRDAFLDALAQSGATLKDVHRATGVSYEQLRKLKDRPGASTNVDDAVKLAHHFGFTLDEFLQDRELPDRLRIVELYNQLSPQERDLLRATARGLADHNSSD